MACKLAASNVSKASLTLIWPAAAGNVAVAAYRIYQDGVQIAEVASDVCTLQVTGLNPGTQYTFQVQAGDATGNWSMDGPSVTVTTQPLSEEAFLYFDPLQYHLTAGETAAVSLMVEKLRDD
jgi:chitodextrinase